MVNTQIRSHWRLAGSALRKAILVTASVAVQYAKARYYIIMNSERLQRKRIDYDKQLLEAANTYLDTH